MSTCKRTRTATHTVPECMTMRVLYMSSKPWRTLQADEAAAKAKQEMKEAKDAQRIAEKELREADIAEAKAKQERKEANAAQTQVRYSWWGENGLTFRRVQSQPWQGPTNVDALLRLLSVDCRRTKK